LRRGDELSFVGNFTFINVAAGVNADPCYFKCIRGLLIFLGG
jgi:hypothetical protein